MKIFVPHFGETVGVEYMNPSRLVYGEDYFNQMVEYFVQNGYERGKTICAAPYDWRLAAGMKQHYMRPKQDVWVLHGLTIIFK